MSKTATKEISKRETKRMEVLAEVAEGRANLYKFFSGFYAQSPSKKTVANLTGAEFLNDMTKLLGKRATESLRQFAEKYQPAKHYKEVEQEFSELFVVPVERKYVSPYESVYVTGLMLQRPHVDVKKTYKRLGAEFKGSDTAHLEDHIACELSFMNFLADGESRAWKKQDSAEAMRYIKEEVEFLEDHLTQWVDSFAKKLENYAAIPLFKGMGKLTARFVELDYAQTADVLEALEGQTD